MPNGNEMNELLEFEDRIRKMTPDEKQDFIARSVYKHTVQFASLPCNINNCPNPKLADRKTIGTSAGLGVGIGAAITAIIEYLLRRGQ